ncbi:MAG: type II toxin-antitoxin system RelE/ParE family toxin [Nitrospirae bacterium]|nr:type II toxin-antitoxin system RelE/ParE family toxin [Nitrospirota bacterium]MBF0534396.1 type II toxin-antitoxin system RelE/ParE family toxin [Nitrospirota bacterium]MBF0615623.1 type II toxin-antitoxin system RelE/ParE family toxin [Nitrospirota bacterium]
MSYSIKIEREAYKSLSKVPKAERIKIIDTIDNLKNNSETGKQLKGKFKELKSIRVGDYRIIYKTIQIESLILIVKIDHRRNAYR